MDTTPTPVQTDASRIAAPGRPRFTAWPLWAAAAGALGMISTVVTDTRVDADEDFNFPVAAEHMATMDYDLFRVGGFTGYLTVICLVIFLAMWRHRVEQRFSWSIGASVVTFGIAVSARRSRWPTAGRARWATTATEAPRRTRTTTWASTPTT